MAIGAIFGTKYRSRDTGARTAEIRGNLYIQGDLDVHGDITQNGEPLSSDGGSTPSYKTYVALLTQSGTDAPVAVVLENTLDGEPQWTRVTAGRFRLTLANAFPTDKTFIMVTGNGVGTAGSVFSYLLTSESAIDLKSLDDSWTVQDDRMNKTSIEIRVYP